MDWDCPSCLKVVKMTGPALRVIRAPIRQRVAQDQKFRQTTGFSAELDSPKGTHLEGSLVLTTFEGDGHSLARAHKIGISRADISHVIPQVMFLPFGYTIDQYRWALFDGTIPREEMNQGWWDLRNKYQGLAPPAPRSEEDFDAGSKYHVPASVPYIRYFIAYVLEFMFYKVSYLYLAGNFTSWAWQLFFGQDLCEVSGQFEPGNPEKPLHRCDYSAGELAPLAGDKLR